MAIIFPMVLTGGMAIKRLANVASNVCGWRLADVLVLCGKNLDLTSGSCTCLMSGKGWQW